jgi:ABC-type multidrug transport system fused ATPase/permease subunit
MTMFSNCGFLGSVWLGGYLLIQNNEITAGTLSSFLFYLIYIVNATSALTELYYEIIKSLGATERLYKISHMKPSIDPKTSKQIPKNIEGNIEFRNVIVQSKILKFCR